MGYKLNFRGLDLTSGYGLSPLSDSPAQDLAEQAVPRRPGSATQDGRALPRPLVIAGGWGGQTLSQWEARKDALSGLMGAAGTLWYGRDDRYYREAQISNIGFGDNAEGRLYGILGTATLTFTAARYPEAFGTTTYTPTLSSTGGTVNYAHGGAPNLAPTLPVWTITINAGGTGPLTLTNATTGETCIIAKPGGGSFSGGDVIVLDRDGNTARLNGVLTVGLYDRRIPRIVPNLNTITLVAGGTATVASLVPSYVPRFR